VQSSSPPAGVHGCDLPINLHRAACRVAVVCYALLCCATRQHKGSSLSMMVELLTAGLTGGAFSFEARERDPDDSNGTPTCNSELLIAIDPAQVG
jgi:LDH2 family malate/lactate/ureidoglycolate dehydrogenase